MTYRHASELTLVVGFLAIIAAAPVRQIAEELRRGQRVQFTDVLRHPPTVANLRRYESALENRSWIRRQIRPAAQQLLFTVWRDAGSKGLPGARNWLFYRPGVRFLLEGDRVAEPDTAARWIAPARRVPRSQAALRTILQYRAALRERGCELVVMPVPEKASIYPDLLARHADPREFRSPSESILASLRSAGVEVVDLFALFRKQREADAATTRPPPLYLATDTHWTPVGARLAAQAVADHIRRHDWLPEYPRKYQLKQIHVERRGDLLEMLQISRIPQCFPAETVQCTQVTDSIIGLLTPRASDREGTFANNHLKDTPLEPTVLLLGDSFCRIYQLPEPKSLGDIPQQPANWAPSATAGTKRLLPGSAGFPSILSELLQSPVDYLVSDGGAATEVRQRLRVNSEILENKRVVVWEFTERDLGLGGDGWQPVPLPPPL